MEQRLRDAYSGKKLQKLLTETIDSEFGIVLYEKVIIKILFLKI